MEGKPSFSGANPESHQSIQPVENEWRSTLGDHLPSDKPIVVQKEVEIEHPIIEPVKETGSVVKPVEKSEAKPTAAIDEVLTDPKVDIFAAQAMIGSFFEQNNGDKHA